MTPGSGRVSICWKAVGLGEMGWWEFEAGDLRYPGYDLERSTLWRAGLLSVDEKAALEVEWKADFETAQAPDFTLHDGNGILAGDRARGRLLSPPRHSGQVGQAVGKSRASAPCAAAGGSIGGGGGS